MHEHVNEERHDPLRPKGSRIDSGPSPHVGHAAASGNGMGGDPFGFGGAGYPFGDLFEQMMGQGAWTRSYGYDPETGEWVEIVEEPEQLPQGDVVRVRKLDARRVNGLDVVEHFSYSSV